MDDTADCAEFVCVEVVTGCNMLSCAKPYYLKSKKIYVGCGSCACCARKRAAAWALRVTQDIKSCKKKRKPELCNPADLDYLEGLYYITLTYNDKSLPVGFDEKGKIIRGDGDGIIYRKDLSLFIKRLRINIDRQFKFNGVRFLGSGEYGPTGTHRPHFHLVVWNADGIDFQEFKALVEKSWSFYDKSTGVRESIGFVNVQVPVNMSDCASYVSKKTAYVAKDGVSFFCKQPGETLEQYTNRTGKLTSPFVGGSLGIGLDYFTESAEEISRLGYCHDGKYPVAIPRFFLDRVSELVGRSFFEHKFERFLKFARSKDVDVSYFDSRWNCVSVVDYLYFNSLLSNYKRKWRYYLTKCLADCGVGRDLFSSFVRGEIPVISGCVSYEVGRFLLEYGDSFAKYSDFVIKYQFFVDSLKKSSAVNFYESVINKLHEGDSVEDIKQRYLNFLAREKIFADRAVCRRMKREKVKALYQFY